MSRNKCMFYTAGVMAVYWWVCIKKCLETRLEKCRRNQPVWLKGRTSSFMCNFAICFLTIQETFNFSQFKKAFNCAFTNICVFPLLRKTRSCAWKDTWQVTTNIWSTCSTFLWQSQWCAYLCNARWSRSTLWNW